MSKSSTYKYCHCGEGCSYLDKFKDQPCWGEVCNAVEIEEGGWIHGCEGHYESIQGGKYIKENLNMTQIKE